MQNFIQRGNVVTLIAPAGGTTSGGVVQVGAIAGVASTTQPAGAEVEVVVEGVFNLVKTLGDAITTGAPVKVNAAGVVDASGTRTIGYATAVAGAGTSTVPVRLVPNIAGATVLAASEEEEKPRRKAS